MRRSFWENIDFAAIFVWICLVSIGLVAIYSTTKGAGHELLDTQMQENFAKQRNWFLICGVFLIVIMSLPIWFFTRLAPVFYIITFILLIVTRFTSRKINGAYSWLVIGPIQLQISEFAKVAGALMVAYLMANRQRAQWEIQQVALAVASLFFPAVILIFVQNDTGTGLVFLALIPIVLYWSGMPLQWVGLMLAPMVTGYLCIFYLKAAIVFALLATAAMYFASKDIKMTGIMAGLTGGLVAAFAFLVSQLQPHQVERIKAISNPEEFASGVGYQTLQSMYTIGAGGFMGEGFMQGTQTQMGYVPEQSTDFVFTVISEEFGFMGSMLVLVLFAILMYRMLYGLNKIQNSFAQYYGICAIGIIFVHIIINIGMTLGVVPVIGIPLPFISYGGTALLANTALFGIAMNFQMRYNEFPAQGI
jgi:rod shape determining protein RodA